MGTLYPASTETRYAYPVLIFATRAIPLPETLVGTKVLSTLVQAPAWFVQCDWVSDQRWHRPHTSEELASSAAFPALFILYMTAITFVEVPMGVSCRYIGLTADTVTIDIIPTVFDTSFPVCLQPLQVPIAGDTTLVMTSLRWERTSDRRVQTVWVLIRLAVSHGSQPIS